MNMPTHINTHLRKCGVRLHKTTVRRAAILAIATLIAGCAINDQRPGFRPQDRLSPEKARAAVFRAQAELVMTGRTKDGRLAYINRNARIKLQPTPGFETIHEKGIEVLTSRESGGYFTFLGLVPITRYFRILRRADCDDWGSNLPILEHNFRMQPNFYLQGDYYQGDKPQFACLSAFDEYYLNHDPRLLDADGVLFDIKTFGIYKNAFHWSLLSQKVKVHIDGWAIQFSDPTPEEIRTILNRPMVSGDSIERLQFQTVVYWIQKNKAVQYVDILLSLLPTNTRGLSGRIWLKEDEFVLQTLARIAPNTTPFEGWMRIIEIGAASFISPRFPVAGESRSTPEIAANVLVCRGEQKEALVRRFAAVVAGPYPFQNKHAAAVALRSLGHGNLAQEQLVNPTSDLSNALSGDSTYKCPYSSPFDAK